MGFGLGFIQEGEVARDTFKFKSNIASGTITFDEGEVIISKEHALEIREEIEKEAKEELEEPVEMIEVEPKVEKEVEVPPLEEKEEGPKKFKQIFLRVTNIPSTRIADLSRGVFMPISREIGSFDLTLEIDLKNEEGILASTIQTKVKETISQIGAKIIKEELK